MAVNHCIENQTGWSIKKFVRAARRYRTVKIKAGRQLLTAAGPLPKDLRDAIIQVGGELKYKSSQPHRRRGFLAGAVTDLLSP